MMLRLRRLALVLASLAALAWSAPAWAEPALWVARSGQATVYIFGTVHYLRPDTAWRSPRIEKALGDSRTLVLEVADLQDESRVQPLLRAYGFDPGHPLSGKIRPSDEPRLAAAAKAVGLARPTLEPMQPWLVALTLSVLPALRAGYDPKSGVELALTAEAKAAGKPIEAFETTEQQVRFLADLPPSAQAQFLTETLDDVDDVVGEIDRLVAAWQAGDLGELEREFVEQTRDRYPEIYRVLVAQRNRAWAEALQARMAGGGTSFVAVGAGHLVGPDSVQAQLKKRGIEAVRQ